MPVIVATVAVGQHVGAISQGDVLCHSGVASNHDAEALDSSRVVDKGAGGFSRV